MDDDLSFEEADDLSRTDRESTRAKEEDDISSMARQETIQLRRFRFGFSLLLVVLGLGFALAMFFLTRNQEKDQFDDTFHDRSTKLKDTFHDRVEQKINAFEAMSFAATSYANFKNMTWPFVTIPDFEVKGANTRSLAETVSVSLYPLVTAEQRSAWESYSREHLDWVQDGKDFEERLSVERRLEEQGDSDVITVIDEDGNRVPASSESIFFPAWQSSPVASELINLDLHSTEIFSHEIDLVWETSKVVIGATEELSTFDNTLEVFKESWSNTVDNLFYEATGPVDKMYFPVFDVLDPDVRKPVGILTSVLYWESYMWGVLPPHQGGLHVVISNDCGHTFTYEIRGEEVGFVGNGDLHESKFDDKKETDVVFRFQGLEESVAAYKGIQLLDSCNYTLSIYPTEAMKDEFVSPAPWLFFALVLAIFIFTIILIFCYDWRVEKNYQETYKKAKHAGAIVSSIFPAAVRRRLYQQEDQTGGGSNKDTAGFQKVSRPTGADVQKAKLRGYLDENHPEQRPSGDESNRRASDLQGEVAVPQPQGLKKTMAELFHETTILFADIVGFTAWSSQREPGEVFMLLQTLYHEFDTIARQLTIFKVETIGDCYVAATGLPEPQQDHALRMARFAARIMNAMIETTRNLEVHLGPDTGELRIRVGMHSGPVTAGVLGGAKARFQLFGDTMNFSARMEHHSLPNRIQCSEATATLIKHAGKEHWLRPREEKVFAKGKGELQTYWLVPKSGTQSISSGGKEVQVVMGGNDGDEEFASLWGNNKLVFDLGTPGNRYQRLIDWNVELLAGLLRQIEAQRRDFRMKRESAIMELQVGSTALDEVTEIITLPQFKEKGVVEKTRADDIELSVDVMTELRDYVTTIASMYRDNSFHNFEHASHVTMSTNKLLKRVTIREAAEHDVDAMHLHDYTFGITSDPLTQFTLVFCALVHDVDHAGVSNFQLIQENATIAQLYKNKSVAEQNSVDLAWDLLMDPNYKELQGAIYGNEDELKRFRQLMVNIVLATDIFDKDMKAIRERRWDKAFQYGNDDEEEEKEAENMPIKALDRDYDTPLNQIQGTNLKATIVMEHLIQASDVAHTMQHWQIYLKWNERLFNEMYTAFENGRAAKNPSLGWYEGEIMFFDKYVIPLAKKLDDCGVFGVASDECLNYATQNRKQWAIKGDSMVDDMVARYKARKGALP